MGLSVADSDGVAAVASISLALSSNSTDINVPRSTDIDLATDMSGHEATSIPEMEIDDRGVISTLRISSMLTGRYISNQRWMRRLSGPNLGARLQHKIMFDIGMHIRVNCGAYSSEHLGRASDRGP